MEELKNMWIPTTTSTEQVKNGNVKFTENGLVFEIPFTNNPDLSQFRRIDANNVMQVVKSLVRGRLHKCLQTVHEKEIVFVTREKMIVFKDGTHYSEKAAESMYNILTYNYFSQFTSLDFNQALKAFVLPYALDEQNRECTWDDEALRRANDFLFEQEILLSDKDF